MIRESQHAPPPGEPFDVSDALERDLAGALAARGTASRAAGPTPDRFLAGVRRRRWQRRARLGAIPALAVAGVLVLLALPYRPGAAAPPGLPTRPALVADVPFPPTATMGSGLVASLVPRAGEPMTSLIGRELLRPD